MLHSRLSPQWLSGNSCTWVHDVRSMMYGLSCVVHHVPKCMSCHKAIVVITGRAHCFHDCMYIMPILLLWDLSTLCVVNHLWLFVYTFMYFYILLYYLKTLFLDYTWGMIFLKKWQVGGVKNKKRVVKFAIFAVYHTLLHIVIYIIYIHSSLTVKFL